MACTPELQALITKGVRNYANRISIVAVNSNGKLLTNGFFYGILSGLGIIEHSLKIIYCDGIIS